MRLAEYGVVFRDMYGKNHYDITPFVASMLNAEREYETENHSQDHAYIDTSLFCHVFQHGQALGMLRQVDGEFYLGIEALGPDAEEAIFRLYDILEEHSED